MTPLVLSNYILTLEHLIRKSPDSVSELIVERVEKYGEIVNKDSATESYHALLADLLRRTKYNTPPQKYDPDSPRIDSIDLIDDFAMLKMELLIFEKNLLMAYLQSLKNFFDYVDRNK